MSVIEETDTDAIQPDLARQLYPPMVMLADADDERMPTLKQTWTKPEQQRFLRKHMNQHIRNIVNQPFGKPSLNHCFKTEATLRHVLAPLFRSGFLCMNDRTTCQTLVKADPSLRGFFEVYEDIKDVDFNALRLPR